MSDIKSWLIDNGFERFVDLFLEHEIDIEAARELTDQHLQELAIPMGQRLKLLKALTTLDDDSERPGRGDVPRVAERRHITTVFVDLVGSTGVSERLDPEDYNELIKSYQVSVSEAVTRYNGYVAKYLGDGVLCYFGWPKAHERSMQNAIRAGLAAAEAVSAMTLLDNETLYARVGIAAGHVVVGDLVGEGEVKDESAIGAAPNIAARLQGIAKPGQVVVAGEIRDLVGDVFTYTPLGEQVLKGIAKPMQVYSVDGEIDDAQSSSLDRDDQETMMVNREIELATLEHCWGKVKSGTGHQVVLDGPPGIGKTRLICEAIDQLWASGGGFQIQLHGADFRQNSAFHPLIVYFRQAFGLDVGDDAETIAAKLEIWFQTHDLDGAKYAPALGELMDVTLPGRFQRPVHPPEQMRSVLISSLLALLKDLSAHRPVLMVVDDLQLVDPSTLELLQLWSGQLEQHKCLLVLVHRSGFEHGLTGADQTTRISLSSLGRGESREIVESIATGQQNLSTVIDDILNRAEGTPLYLQELTKMVLQARVAELAGQTERSGTPGAGAYLPDIPGSLQDLLLARLDQLAEARYIAQVAATIGRSFEVDVLVAVADKPEQDVLAALDMLVRADLVGKRSFQNRRIYEFQHALMRDAAYSTLLSSTRRALHMKIAGVYETGFQDQIQSNPEILAYHFQQANMVEEAIRYFQQAGHRQARQSAHREAASHAHEALDLLATLPASQKNHEIEVDLQLMLGDALTATYGYAAEGTGDAYRRAHELCVENPASPHSLPAVYGLWDYHFVGCDGARALELAREMLDDAVASGNTLQEMTARGMLTQNLTTIGKFEDAIRHAARALDLYRGGIDTYRNLNYGEHPLIAAQCFMAWALWWTGKPDQALSRIETGLSEARVLGHSNTTVLALIFCAAIHRWRGEVALTEQLADEAIDYSAELDMGFWQPEPLALKAWAVSQAGDHATALDLLAASDAAWRDSDESTHILSHLSVLSGHVFMNAGRPKEALAAAERGIAVGTEIAETWHASELHWLRAASQLALGASVAETCASFETALQIAKAQNARSIELRVATTLAQQPSDGSGPGETRSPLSEIYASFDEGLETRDLQSAARLL